MRLERTRRRRSGVSQEGGLEAGIGIRKGVGSRGGERKGGGKEDGCLQDENSNSLAKLVHTKMSGKARTVWDKKKMHRRLSYFRTEQYKAER